MYSRQSIGFGINSEYRVVMPLSPCKSALRSELVPRHLIPAQSTLYRTFDMIHIAVLIVLCTV